MPQCPLCQPFVAGPVPGVGSARVDLRKPSAYGQRLDDRIDRGSSTVVRLCNVQQQRQSGLGELSQLTRVLGELCDLERKHFVTDCGPGESGDVLLPCSN